MTAWQDEPLGAVSPADDISFRDVSDTTDNAAGTVKRSPALPIVMAGSAVTSILSTPPGSPAEGDAYIIGASATGAWAGQENALTLYHGAAWRFYAPAEGWRVWDRDTDALKVYDGAAWSNISAGGGGGVADRTYSTTVALSGSSTDWSIPADCTRVKIILANGSLSGTVANPRMALLKASGGAAGLFTEHGFRGTSITATPQTSLVGLTTTSGLDRFGIVACSAASGLAIDAEINFPRSASKKTFGSWQFIVPSGSDVMRGGASVADTAEDHNTLRFSGATTMSGTVHIAYTIEETI